MSRIEITGQFSVDNGFSAWNREEVKVDTQTPLPMVPANWASFCDSANHILAEVTAAKAWFRIWYTVGLALIIALAILPHIFLRIGKVRDGLPPYYFVGVFLFILPLLYASIAIRGKLRRPMEKLDTLCSERSGNGILYQLLNENYGGCSKPHVKRYYIMVFTDEEQQQESAVPGGAFADEFKTDPKPEAYVEIPPPYTQTAVSTDAASTTGGLQTQTNAQTSIFDQLKG